MRAVKTLIGCLLYEGGGGERTHVGLFQKCLHQAAIKESEVASQDARVSLPPFMPQFNSF